MKRSFEKDPSLLEVAKIGKTVGLDGKVKLHLSTDFPEQFKKGARFFSGSEEFVLESFERASSTARFKGYDDVDKASCLANKIIYTTIEATRESCGLKNGEFFWFDVVGLEVCEEGETLGRISSIERYGAVDYLLIATSEELVKEGFAKSFLLPYQDRFVSSVSLEERKVYATFAKDILSES